MTDDLELTRRTALAALGTVGIAAAGAGLGTSAYLSDGETFENNSLVAGSLDVGVGYSAHYADGSDDEDDGIAGSIRTFDGGPNEVGTAADLAGNEIGFPADDAWLIAVGGETAEAAVDNASTFLDNTRYRSFNQDGTLTCENGRVPEGAQADDAEAPVIDLTDVKPGDFGEVTVDFVICDNPGFVWLDGTLRSASENGTTEPEAGDPDERDGVVELLDVVQAAVWVDDGNNWQNDDEEPIVVDSLRNVLGMGGALDRSELGTLLNGDIAAEAGGGTGAIDCFSGNTQHSLVFAWWVPVDHGNEIQTDSAAFDLSLYAEQCRHNEGSGLVSGVGTADGLVAYYPLDGAAADASGNGYDGTAEGGVTYASGQVGQAASFDGDDDHVSTDLNVGGSGESMTVAGWLNAPAQSVTRNHFVVSNYVDRSHRGFFAIGTDDGDGLFFWTRDPTTNESVRTAAHGPAFDGRWHHYAGVRDANAERIGFYIDGALKETAAFPGDVAVRDDDSVFGMMQHFGDRNLAGQVDDVRVYDRALSASEVASLHDSA
jgi:predicted ribosomally synthesized peptide with SipW-like signal peptide